MSILESINDNITIILEKIVEFNKNAVDLSKIYLFIDAEELSLEITNTKDFSTLENSVFVCDLRKIDPNSLLEERDVGSLFVRDAITRLIASFILRSR